MNCFAISFFVVALVGADQKLWHPPTRLESVGDATQMVLTADGNSLFAVIKDGDRQDFVAWDIPSKSKTVLAKGTDGAPNHVADA